jgi:hypothetical protein
MGEDDTFQPKSLMIHEVDFISNLQRLLGVVNFDIAYGNFFSGASLCYELTYLVEDAIKQGNINIKNKEKLLPDVDTVYQIRKLYDGQCFLTIESGLNGAIPHTELFHYDTSKIDFRNPNLEIIPLPALDHMTPIGQIKDDTLLIEIHESIPCRFAWQGLSYETLIGDGNMIHSFSDGVTPRVTREQMNSTVDQTRYISRDVYFKIMKKLKNKFKHKWSIIYNNYHSIIEYVKLGGDIESEFGGKISAMGKVE